ncbi:hypothetical protein HanHA300_Chr10g0351741 [Helianthus annuus]|nr:hypothetical protein HanHA300_Chr10g0351741 [Helianthus annuus]KAJ0529058.1 hypothetical protein HanHA89_Chr10g0373421 [Helianthus annuus]
MVLTQVNGSKRAQTWIRQVDARRKTKENQLNKSGDTRRIAMIMPRLARDVKVLVGQIN